MRAVTPGRAPRVYPVLRMKHEGPRPPALSCRVAISIPHPARTGKDCHSRRQRCFVLHDMKTKMGFTARPGWPAHIPCFSALRWLQFLSSSPLFGVARSRLGRRLLSVCQPAPNALCPPMVYCPTSSLVSTRPVYGPYRGLKPAGYKQGVGIRPEAVRR